MSLELLHTDVRLLYDYIGGMRFDRIDVSISSNIGTQSLGTKLIHLR